MGDPEFAWASVAFEGQQPGRTLVIAQDLSPTLQDLIKSESIPWLQEQLSIPFLTLRQHSMMPPAKPTPRSLTRDEVKSCRPMLSDADGNMVIGAFPRGDGGWCWALPHSTDHPELWLAEALTTWQEFAPERFPQIDPWRTRSAWMTAPERAAHEVRDQHVAKRDDMLLDLKKQGLEIDARILAAEKSAEQGPRRLLTSQGDTLVDAVMQALTGLGFLVEDIDDERDSQGLAKVEDLNVTDPGHSQKVLAEVKGYTGGAKASDLIAIGRHAVRFVKRTGDAPDRTWYVVNQFLDRDPDARQRPLAGAPEDIKAFSDTGGLIIDTRDLFTLTQDVAAGAMSDAQARDTLLEQTGVFNLSPPGPE